MSEESIPDFDDILSILVFGDIHFKPKDFEACQEFSELGIQVARQICPTAIILLGDIMDSHETAKTPSWKQACYFIEVLSTIAPVHVLMGNHDLINQKQFLTDNHFFNPLKKWNNVTIVDVPMHIIIGGYSVVMCPYVPPGMFEEALDSMHEYGGCEEDFDWRTQACCIFGHQEIEGVEYNGSVSTKGDHWREDYPTLICGHIHNPFQIGNNVFYPGSSRQVDSNENPDKKVWNVSFDDEGILEYDKIDLGLKAKKEIDMTCENVSEFDFELCEKYYIKIKLHGTPEQFKVFRKSHLHAKLKQNDVKIGFYPIKMEASTLSEYGIEYTQATKDDLSFDAILKKLVSSKSDLIRERYEKLYQCEIKKEMKVEFVFDEDSNSEEENSDE